MEFRLGLSLSNIFCVFTCGNEISFHKNTSLLERGASNLEDTYLGFGRTCFTRFRVKSTLRRKGTLGSKILGTSTRKPSSRNYISRRVTLKKLSCPAAQLVKASKFHYSLHKIPPQVPMWSQMIQAYILPPYVFQSNFIGHIYT